MRAGGFLVLLVGAAVGAAVVAVVRSRSSSAPAFDVEIGPATIERFVPPYKMPDWQRFGTLEAVHPAARPHFDELFAYAKGQGWNPRVASAVRTCTEQAELLRQGSTHAACSWHLAGRAVDVLLGAPPAKGKPATWNPLYDELGAWWQDRGGSWGGTFTGYGDHGDFQHFQWTPPPLTDAAHGLCAGDDCEAKFRAYWDDVVSEANQTAA